jgi:N-acetylglucosamine-6-phosphate deacetylase
MDAGIRNLHDWLDIPSEQVWSMGTLNVATLFGLKDLGRMSTGAAADLVLWDNDLTVRKTWIRGELAFEK